MSDVGPADQTTTKGASETSHSSLQSTWDIANLLEQCVAGALSLLGRILRTLGWMLFRPKRLAQHLAGYMLAARREDLETLARREAQTSLTDAAVEGGLLTRSDASARRTVEALARSLGNDRVTVRTAD